MTINELLQWLEQYQQVWALWFVAVPLLTYVGGALLKVISPLWARYLLATAIYLAVVPGVGMIVVLLYMVFFVRLNLLHEMHLVLHLLPIVSMLATLWAATRLAPFAAIPGFDRLQGLLLLVGLSFAALLWVHKMFIGIVFFAKFEYLLLLLGGFLVLWRLGIARVLQKHKHPSAWQKS
jgi:hypothetical protein